MMPTRNPDSQTLKCRIPFMLTRSDPMAAYSGEVGTPVRREAGT
jgi:hypothetical protein